MATYQDIYNAVQSGKVTMEQVQAAANKAGINIPTTSSGGMASSGQMTWKDDADVRAAQQAAGMKDSVLVKEGTTGAGVNQRLGIGGSSTKNSLIEEKDIEEYPWLEGMEGMEGMDESMLQALNNLSMGNKGFMDLVNKNFQVQFQKNQQLQNELFSYKQKVDQDFQFVRNKFDDNAQKQIDRINTLESTYMKNMNEIRSTQADYNTSQQKALEARIGGEQAGLQQTLSSKGIDQSVINDAMAQARTKHLDQFNSLHKQNLDILTQLNEAYNTFAQQVHEQRSNLEYSDLALVKEKFDLNKQIQDMGTKLNQDMISGSFSPLEDALGAQLGSHTKEMGYAAQDTAIAERFKAGSETDRMQLLQNKLDNITTDGAGNSKLTEIDMAMLKKAVGMNSYAEALQYLLNAGKAVATSAPSANSTLAKAAVSGNLDKAVSDSINNTSSAQGASVAGDREEPASNAVSSDSESFLKKISNFVLKGLSPYWAGKFMTQAIINHGINPTKRPESIVSEIKKDKVLVDLLKNLFGKS